MKKYFITFIVTVVLGSFMNVFGQAVIFPDDARQWGYYDRPYKRYEAEPSICITTGEFLQKSYDQRDIQSEASNAIATNLNAKDQFILWWTNEEPADGLTIRFSLPDSEDRKGTKGTIALLVNEVFVRNIELDSYWAWQWFQKTNSPGEFFPRMRYDEVRVKLDEPIGLGAAIKLVKVDDNDIPYTIDFIELEMAPPPVKFEDITDENKVAYPGTGSLKQFILNNGGKTIYIPEGRFEEPERIYLPNIGTKIIGAGMWYTEVYFSAAPDDPATFNQRGFESTLDNCVIEGLYINTFNNVRYYNGANVGMAFNNSFGKGSLIKDCWVTHFEAGGWFTGTQNLTMQGCRIRNNYADGVNFASSSTRGSSNCIVEHCSFRNNGDDDMASWSNGVNAMCEFITFRYNTVENNWRASGLAFFGGKQHKAHNIVIRDGLESGFRLTADFQGAPFSTDGFITIDSVVVYNGGAKPGEQGIDGDVLSGGTVGALHLTSLTSYDLNNIRISNIELHNSKWNGIYINSWEHEFKDFYLENIIVNGAVNYGVYFGGTSKGQIFYNNITYNAIGGPSNVSNIPAAMQWTPITSPTKR